MPPLKSELLTTLKILHHLTTTNEGILTISYTGECSAIMLDIEVFISLFPNHSLNPQLCGRYREYYVQFPEGKILTYASDEEVEKYNLTKIPTEN